MNNKNQKRIAMRKKQILVLPIFLFFCAAYSQTSTGTYTFGTVNNNPFTYNGTAVNNLSVSALTIIGASWSSSSGNFRGSNWGLDPSTSGQSTTNTASLTGSVDLSKYIQFTLTAGSNFYIHNPSITFGIGRSATGPRQFQWRSSIDNFTNPISIGTANANLTNNTGVLTTPDANSGYTGNTLTISQTGLSSITFRFYAYNSEQTGGTGGIQGDLTFSISINNSLPVELTNYSAAMSGKFNSIKWSTASEQNNSGFDIQRSTDGVNFEKIGFVKSLSTSGNSSSRLDYSFTDHNPAGLKQYYRLKQIDFDGAYKYSAIVLVTREAPTSLELTRVYPNPTQESVYINAAAHKNMDLQLFIYDFGGRVIGKKQVVAQIGNNGFDMPVAHLAPGTYFIKVVNSAQEVVATQKFIKQ